LLPTFATFATPLLKLHDSLLLFLFIGRRERSSRGTHSISTYRLFLFFFSTFLLGFEFGFLLAWFFLKFCINRCISSFELFFANGARGLTNPDRCAIVVLHWWWTHGYISTEEVIK
jgi:hypothetical protein